MQKAKLFVISALENIYEEREAGNIAVLLLEWITGKNKTAQYLNKLHTLTTTQQYSLLEATKRLQQHEPIQYIIGEAWFMGLAFTVTPATLIPRPETEELVEWILTDLKNTAPQKINVLDIGTGSGCIPITLKHKAPLLSVQTIDISHGAIECAQQNAATHHTDIDCLPLDFTDESNWAQLSSYNIIVSNPPYIKEVEQATMHRNVLEYEPASALFVPNNNPLLFYRKIKQFSATHLQPNGLIYVEINEQLGAEVVALFTTENNVVELRKDMQGKERMVKISKK